MKWSRFNVIFSFAVFFISIAYLLFHGLNYSIDFTGGAEINLKLRQAQFIDSEKLSEHLHQQGHRHLQISEFLDHEDGERHFSIKMQREKTESYEETVQRAEKIPEILKEAFPEQNVEVTSISTVSGKVGAEEERRGFFSLFLACLGILIYMGIRFDQRFAPGAVISVFHDIVIALAFMTLLGTPFSISSIAAFLTIMGYSINDTVIIYDRIRENQIRFKRLSLEEIVNLSINQTLNRTFLTSFLGLFVLLSLTVFSKGELHDFASTMLVGVLMGTYSSIYVAAPMTLVMSRVLEKFGFQKLVRIQQPSVAANDVDFCPPLIIRRKTILNQKNTSS
jgi:preprotein translocase subunit SecF